MSTNLPTVRAAAVQAEPVVLNRDATVEKACSLISEAATNGANLIVFPELFIPTYVHAAIWGTGIRRLVTTGAKGVATTLAELSRGSQRDH